MSNQFSRFAVLISSMVAVQVAILASLAPADEPPMPTISVTGTAEIRVVPDEAVLTFSIESRETELDDAVKDNDEKIKAVTDFLTASKIKPENVRTDVILIQPIFEQVENPDVWKGQIAVQANAPSAPRNAADNDGLRIKPIGYTAKRQLSVTIVNLESFETTYRGLIKKGVNDVGGIQFRTTELRKHRDTARLQAIRAAREKASAMATELGATLATVHTITENSQPNYGYNFMQNSISAVASDGSSSISAGMIEISASVHVVFKLGETELK